MFQKILAMISISHTAEPNTNKQLTKRNKMNELLKLEEWLADGEAAGYIKSNASQVWLEDACLEAGTTIHSFREWATENA